ncbi:hypothetical protein FO519_009026 [Halicephalobus sp. NKZ332]|nr:hypothetical protein FO519_009026 [Halicephalobus sp. NKZ332]
MDHTVFEFDITEDVVDEDGYVARGVIEVLLDTLMGLAFWEPYNRGIKFTGVTADMSFTFMDSAKLGDTLVFVNDTIKSNEFKGFFKGEVYRKSDNALIATGKQTLIFKIRSKI